MSVNGLVVMTPTSIASTGTGNSSSIGANGKVTFSSCATLSLNGVFTSSYDNYMISMRSLGTVAATEVQGRLRASGTDASGSNYTRQYIIADNTSVTGGRETTQTVFRFGVASSTQRSGDTCFIFGPQLAQPTAIRNVSASGYLSAYLVDAASTHSLSTSYDGLTFIPASGTFSGLVTVYGFNQ